MKVEKRETVKNEPQTNETFVQPRTIETFVEPRTNGTFVEPRTNESFVQPRTTETFVQPRTNGSFVEPRTNETFVAPRTNGIFVEPQTNGTFDEPQTNETFESPLDDSFSDEDFTDESDDSPDIQYVGKRKYVKTRVFKGVEAEIVEEVPNDINGTSIYQVPMQTTLANCKGRRPWGHAQSSKIKAHKKGPRLLFNCRGSYFCKNVLCKNVQDFGINRVDFELNSLDERICAVCGTQATFLSCGARLVLEKHLEDKIVICKHTGDHTCPKQVQGRKKDVEKLTEQFPSVTREMLIRQQVGNAVENGGFENGIAEARQYTDVRYVDSVRTKAKAKRRPDGHSFQAIKRLKESFQPSDPFLIYDFDDGTDNSRPYVIKSSRRKVELLSNLNMDGSHRLATETVHLDVLHSR